MKTTWIHSLIGTLLALLGFRSCQPLSEIINDQPDMYGPPPIDYPMAEYGCPSADYKFVGEAVDPDGNPIPGIRIVVAPYGLENAGPYSMVDTLYTDEAGKAACDLQMEIFDEGQAQVKFQDVDGEQNGAFQDLVIGGEQIESQQTGEGDGHWYMGEFTLTAKAVLQKKTEEE